MTTCSIIGCRTYIRKKQPDLSLHKLPNDKEKRKSWLNIIGEQNIDMTKTRTFVCSVHFEDWCFNKTMDQMRLKDDAVPSKMLLPTARLVGLLKEKNTTTVPDNARTIKRKGDFLTEDAFHALPPAKASKGVIMVPTTARGAQPLTKASTSKENIIVPIKSIARDAQPAQPLTKASTSKENIIVPTKSIARDAQGKTLCLSVRQGEEDIPLNIITTIPNIISNLSKNVENQNQSTRCQKIRLQDDRIKKLKLKVKNLKAIVRRRDKKISST